MDKKHYYYYYKLRLHCSDWDAAVEEIIRLLKKIKTKREIKNIIFTMNTAVHVLVRSYPIVPFV